MGELQHRLFGTIDPASEEYWEATVALEGREIEVDLNVEDDEVDQAAFRSTLSWLDRLPELTALAAAAIRNDPHSSDDSAVALYLEHHQDELGDGADLNALFERLQIVRIGPYPNDDEDRVVVDWSIGRDVTDYIVSVYVDASGRVSHVELES